MAIQGIIMILNSVTTTHLTMTVQEGLLLSWRESESGISSGIRDDEQC